MTDRTPTTFEPMQGLAGPAQQAMEYWVDGWQRTILFWDLLRRRSTAYYEQRAKPVPHVLSFDAELVKRDLPGKVEELKSSKEGPLGQELEILTYELMGMISQCYSYPAGGRQRELIPGAGWDTRRAEHKTEGIAFQWEEKR